MANDTTIWMSHSGNPFNFSEPEMTMFKAHILDILIPLSREIRGGGHQMRSSRPLTVLEHLWLCDQVSVNIGWSPRLQLHALVHDFCEAFCKDIPQPLKVLLPEYRAYEKRVQAAIETNFVTTFLGARSEAGVDVLSVVTTDDGSTDIVDLYQLAEEFWSLTEAESFQLRRLDAYTFYLEAKQSGYPTPAKVLEQFNTPPGFGISSFPPSMRFIPSDLVGEMMGRFEQLRIQTLKEFDRWLRERRG